MAAAKMSCAPSTPQELVLDSLRPWRPNLLRFLHAALYLRPALLLLGRVAPGLRSRATREVELGLGTPAVCFCSLLVSCVARHLGAVSRGLDPGNLLMCSFLSRLCR